MKKLVKFTAILMFFIQLTGCIREEATTIFAYLINQSKQDITVLCYKNGVVLPDDTIRISHGDTFIFGSDFIRGDKKVSGFSSEYFGSLDDHIEVVFNDEYIVYHYLNIVGDTTVPHYLYLDDRNIMNSNNYEFEMIRTKRESVNYHYYTFTEADYEFAKE